LQQRMFNAKIASNAAIFSPNGLAFSLPQERHAVTAWRSFYTIKNAFYTIWLKLPCAKYFFVEKLWAGKNHTGCMSPMCFYVSYISLVKGNAS